MRNDGQTDMTKLRVDFRNFETDGQTDRTKLKVAFLNFENVIKIFSTFCVKYLVIQKEILLLI